MSSNTCSNMEEDQRQKETERQIRKAAIAREASNRSMASSTGSMSSSLENTTTTNNNNNTNVDVELGVDDLVQAKEQEKMLRKVAIQHHASDSSISLHDSSQSLDLKPAAKPAAKMALSPMNIRQKLAAIRQASQKNLNGSFHNLMNASNHSLSSMASTKEQEKMIRKAAILRQTSQHSLNGSLSSMASTKEQEKKIRKAAIHHQASQRSLNGSNHSLSSMASNKEQEKKIRKAAIRHQASQRSLNGSNHSLSSVNSMHKKPAAVVAAAPPKKKAPPSHDPAMAAKEREKQLRQNRIRSLSPVRAASARAVVSKAAAAVPMPPPGSPVRKKDPAEAAKEREKEIRLQRIRGLSPVPPLARGRSATARAPPSPPDDESPITKGGTKDPMTAAKERERQVRKDIMRSRSPVRPPAAAATAAAAKAAPMPPDSSKNDPIMAAKERERQVRKEVDILSAHSRKPAALDGSLSDDSSAVSFGDDDNTAEEAKIPAKKSQAEVDAEAKRIAAGGSIGAVQPGAAFCPVPVGAPNVPGGLSALAADEERFEAKISPAIAPSGLEETASCVRAAPDAVVATVDAQPGALPGSAPIYSNGSSDFDLKDSTSVDSSMKEAAVQQDPAVVNPMRYDTENCSDEISDVESGLIQATLVEDVVEATIATAQPADDMIRKQSAEETERVRKWRLIVCLALLATGVAVTVSTYMLLKDREHENFLNVYAQFARALGNAAVEQQVNLRKSLRMFADTVSNTAEVHGNGSSPWPYFIMPRFEMIAADFKRVSHAEFVGLQNYVNSHQRDRYVDFITPRYEDFVKESHMQAYGNLNFLNNDTSLYQPYIAQKLENGSFVPDIERPYYFARNHQSPPARAYGPTINNNLLVNGVINDGFHAAMRLNEHVFTTIKGFANLPADEHAKMHSNGAEGANNPHSFTFQPIHEKPGDYESRVVAMFAVATAWDYSMLNLLPDNVKGMYCIVQNTCNQSVTYRVDGADATYLGDGELQNHDYDHMSVFVDLNTQENPNASTTPGHCQYSMRIYPSIDFEDDYKTNAPAVYASVVACTFVLIGFMYFLYDLSVTKRNEKMISNAAKTNAVLTKLVPDKIRDRIMGFDGDGSGDDEDDMGVSRKEFAQGFNEMEASRRSQTYR